MTFLLSLADSLSLTTRLDDAHVDVLRINSRVATVVSGHIARNDKKMTRRPEFDLLYPNNSCDGTNHPGASRPCSKSETRGEDGLHCKESEEENDLLLLEAYVHRSRTEELEKRLNLQQNTHFTAAADLQTR